MGSETSDQIKRDFKKETFFPSITHTKLTGINLTTNRPSGLSQQKQSYRGGPTSTLDLEREAGEKNATTPALSSLFLPLSLS